MFDEVGQRAAVAVGAVLCWVGDERDALVEDVVYRELGGLWSPAADGVAGFLGFGGVDAFPV